MVWGFPQWCSAANFPGTGSRCPCPTTWPANSTSLTKIEALFGLAHHAVLFQDPQYSEQVLLMRLDEIVFCHVLCHVINKRVGTISNGL